MKRRWTALAVPLAAALAFAALTYTPAPAATSSSPRPMAGCFGNLCVQFAGKDAYLGEHKLGGDPSGALYFTPSLDNGLNGAPCDTPPDCPQMVWYKLHPAGGNFYTWENFSPPWGGSSPRANGRIIALDEGPAGQCMIVWPDWTKDPTMCFLVRDGGAVVEAPHTMGAREQASVAEYQKNARAAIPLEYR